MPGRRCSPTIPIFFTIHGTNEDEAIAMVKERLGITPVRPDGRCGEGRRGGRAMMHARAVSLSPSFTGRGSG